VYVPSVARSVKFKEITNHNYMNILKFIQNNDDTGLVMYLEHLISDRCNESVKGFDRLDKYCIVLTMIMICIGNQLEYTMTCPVTDKEFNIEINVGHIISSINDIEITETDASLGGGDFITLCPPMDLHAEVETLLKQIHINGKTYDISNYTSDQLDNLVSMIPYNIFTELQQIHQSIHSKCDNIVYYKYVNPHMQENNTTEYKLNLFDGSFFRFIKTLLREDLLGYYKVYYSLSTKFKFDMQYIESITPAETKTYMSLIREDIKKRDEARKPDQSITGPAGIDPGAAS